MGPHALAHGKGGYRQRGAGQDPRRRLAARHEPSDEGGLSQGRTAGARGPNVHRPTQTEGAPAYAVIDDLLSRFSADGILALDTGSGDAGHVPSSKFTSGRWRQRSISFWTFQI